MTDVLLIDDETEFVKDLAEGLRIGSGNLNVIATNCAEKALQILRTAMIDVIVTDLSMPGMDGFELIGRIQRQFPHVPIIIMSACGRDAVRDRLKGVRIAAYMEKPLDLGEVSNAIRAVA